MLTNDQAPLSASNAYVIVFGSVLVSEYQFLNLNAILISQKTGFPFDKQN